MSVIEEAVVARMLADSALAALIDQRLYPLVIPQDVALPAVAYQKIDSPKTSSHSGRSDLARSRFQFACLAATYAGAKALASAVVDCWWGWRGTAAGVRIDGSLVENDSDSEIDRGSLVEPVVMIDVVIWHAEG
jgi:hypothetical protein